jgi:hypothetical protein
MIEGSLGSTRDVDDLFNSGIFISLFIKKLPCGTYDAAAGVA